MLTHAFQKVGDDLPAEPQGATDFMAFRHAIDAFPWVAEHALWDEQQEGALPAVVLQNVAAQRELWVTLLGDGADLGGAYLIQSVSMQFRKSLFGKGKMAQDAAVVDVPSRAAVDRLCELFCDSAYEALDREVARLSAQGRDD
ncbi:hypothetical protein [Variovorax sp. ZT4R33]|uniref:hypothetical protein n=1 Tax=Variovorax sp. ZT4R33 TaxID=3443743 RepID=UPI003F4803CE